MWVKLLSKIKKKRDWSGYKMADEIGISQTQLKHYEAKGPSTRELILVRLQEISGLSVEEFWDALKEEVAELEKELLKKKMTKLQNGRG